MADFFKYFEKKWLKCIPKKYRNVSNLDYRTNNICEGNALFESYGILFSLSIGWHTKFNNRVEKRHPTIWHLFQCLQRKELSFRQKLATINNGCEVGSNNTKCAIHMQIDKLNERYEQQHIDLIEFLYILSTLVAKNSK